MRLFPASTRYPIEFALLALLVLFLPAFEAPKNIFWVAYAVAWIVNRIKNGDFGGKWRTWDTLIVVWIASGYIVAAFAGLHHNEWLEANDILRYGSIFWLVMRGRYDAMQLRWLLGAVILSTLLALALGFWHFYVAHIKDSLQLHSVGHVNHSAIYLAMVYGAGLFMVIAFWREWSTKIRTLALSALGAIGIALFLSESQAAVGTMLMLTLTAGVLWRRASRGAFFLLFAATVATVAIAYMGHVGVVKKSVTRIEKQDVASGRLEIWNVAREAWREFPAFGVGMGNYGKISLEHVREWVTARGEKFHPDHYLGNAHAHSLYFNALAERGAFGFATLAVVLVMWARALWRGIPGLGAPPVAWALWGGAFSALFVTVVIGVVNTTLHHEHAILAVLLLGMWLSHESERAPET
jgi:O-antigen ligase